MQVIAALFWILVFWAAFSMLATIPTWLLWNWLVPPVFGLTKITIFQTFGLLLLAGPDSV